MKIASKKALVLKKSHEQLDKFLKDKSEALPRDFNETRFIQNCMQVLQDVKGIENMQPVSVARTLLKGAFLSLDFFMRECYAIPYGSKLNFQTDYTGERKLALMYSRDPIVDIYAKVVREGEFFESGVNEQGQQYLVHKEDGFSNAEMVGAYAIAIYEDGHIRYEKMSKKDIEDVRENFSKQKNGLMWTKRPGEAYKKTAMRLLCKTIEVVFDNQEQAKAFEDGGDVEFKDNDKKKPEKSPYDTPIDVDYEDVEDEEKSEQTDKDNFGDKVEEALKE